MDDATAQATATYLARQGRIIESGFLILMHRTDAPDVGPQLLDMLRAAFFAGAQHMHALSGAALQHSPLASDRHVWRQARKEMEAYFNSPALGDE